MRHKNISLDVLVKGNPTTEYSKDGNRYIEGRKGSEYTLRVKNHTGDKVLFVPTIDGLSVLNGNPGNYDSSGYILGPYETYEITGWRISNQQTRKFEFVRHSKSYAKKVGESTDNLGVIGLMAFKEVIDSGWTTTPAIPTWPQWTYKNVPYYGSGVGGGGSFGLASSGTPVKEFYSATSQTVGGKLSIASASLGDTRSVNKSKGTLTAEAAPQATVGTGMGSKQKSVVQSAHFERQPLPFSTISVYYYERKQLEQMGVTRKVQRKEHMPQAFPAADNFCRQV